jgi:hypothetical protein
VSTNRRYLSCNLSDRTGADISGTRDSPADPAGHAGLGVSLAMLNDLKAQAQLSWPVRTALGPATGASE